jgi:hypothetical protein
MITWILSIWSWISKLSLVVKVVSFIPIIKQYWTFIVIGVLIIWITVLKFQNLGLENKYLKYQNEITAILAEHNKSIAIAKEKESAAAKVIIYNNKANNVEKKLIHEELKNADNSSDAILNRMCSRL